jgi:site-specific DNA-methyltransferase (adenine-specific)
MPPQYIRGDCLEILDFFYEDSSFDLIMTSPPYADARKKTYGGVAPDKYVEWFLPRGAEFLRVLKPTGSFVLNIKEKVVNGQRHTYVLELILALQKQGWLWTEEYIWHKSNCFPGKWPNRFRDAWERCLHFTKQKTFSMYQEAVQVPAGEWQRNRLVKESRNDGTRQESTSGSRFSRKVSNWIGRELAYPTNVVLLAPVCQDVGHSAAFPEPLPEWFIRLFTQEGDVVLDPFSGSGTTARVACRLGRKGVGIEIQE